MKDEGLTVKDCTLLLPLTPLKSFVNYLSTEKFGEMVATPYLCAIKTPKQTKL